MHAHPTEFYGTRSTFDTDGRARRGQAVMAIEYNPFDPAQVDHQLPVLARLRREAPVSEVVPGVFYLSRHADIVDVCRAPQLFRQGRFVPLEIDTRSEDQLNLGETNPPQHTRVRKILAALMSPPRVRQMEPLVRDVSEELVDRFARRGHAELIADLGAPLPGAVIGPLTGLPAETHGEFRRYSDDYMSRTDPDPEVVTRASARVDAFDAMATDRPYKKAWPVKRAVTQITAQAGRHFDPTLVRIFVGLDHEVLTGPLKLHGPLNLHEPTATPPTLTPPTQHDPGESQARRHRLLRGYWGREAG